MADQKTNHDTRERILDVAELLFMAHGYEGTSMRVITTGAEVNLAAVNYHFGSKEALLCEVFRRRLSWLNRERLHALDLLEAEAAGAPLKPSQILEQLTWTWWMHNRQDACWIAWLVTASARSCGRRSEGVSQPDVCNQWLSV